MVWRVSPAHKRLQTRMEHMRRFRRQHEQLRTVIVRVLRPTGRDVPAITQGGEGDSQPASKEAMSLEAADASAIEVGGEIYYTLFLVNSNGANEKDC